MKRSRKLTLTLLGAAPVVLTACGRDTTDLTYQTLDECISDGKATAQACSSSYEQALKQHLAQAPRFYNPGACESEYGGCTRYDQGGSSFWMPLMAGYLAGRWSSHYGSSGRPYLETYGNWAPRPLYRTQDDWSRGTYSSWGGGSTYSSRGGWGGGSSWSSTGGGSGKISTSTLSRGGFGGSSSARGGWGGGS